MVKSSTKKFQNVIDSFKKYERIAVAFSGGVDSTLLLKAATEAVGPSQVVALNALSCLGGVHNSENCVKVIKDNFPRQLKFERVEVYPLTWKDFVQNSQERCYFCKKQIYMALHEARVQLQCDVLADGTNLDDLGEHRPGLKAVRELGVITPLADVGLTKAEIRKVSKELGLTNHDLVSNSCLATRIQTNTPIDQGKLQLVENAEDCLQSLGFIGCRVRLSEQVTIIEVQEADIAKIAEPAIRQKISVLFKGLNLNKVVLALQGR